MKLIEVKYPDLTAIPLAKLNDYKQQLRTCFCADYKTSSIINNEIQRVHSEQFRRHKNDPFNPALAEAIGLQ